MDGEEDVDKSNLDYFSECWALKGEEKRNSWKEVLEIKTVSVER